MFTLKDGIKSTIPVLAQWVGTRDMFIPVPTKIALLSPLNMQMMFMLQVYDTFGVNV